MSERIVASFNANSLRARLPVLTRWLQDRGPDILCIQETKVQDKDFPLAALDELGYRAVFHGQKSYNGVAILSREAPTAWSAGLGDGEEESPQARLIEASFPGLTLINTYVPQGHSLESPKYAFKLEWFRRFRRYLEERHDPSKPVLWLGDLNVAPEDQDVHDPKRLKGHVCFNPEVTAALQDVMDWGFQDLVRQHHPEPGLYTFWDYRVPNGWKRGVGWRIDHLMGTGVLVERCRDAWVDPEPRGWEKPSDHTFVLARFES